MLIASISLGNLYCLSSFALKYKVLNHHHEDIYLGDIVESHQFEIGSLEMNHLAWFQRSSGYQCNYLTYQRESQIYFSGNLYSIEQK